MKSGRIVSQRPVGVDLFSGAGGMSLGFEQAGFHIAAAVEIDPIHACIHHFNFPQTTVIPKSVQDLTGEEIRKRAGITGKVDVVFGGAPCQGFSMIRATGWWGILSGSFVNSMPTTSFSRM